jgi:hypothetical protein
MQSYNSLVNVDCSYIMCLVATALHLDQTEVERAIDHYRDGCTYRTVLSRQTCSILCTAGLRATCLTSGTMHFLM